MAGAYCFSGAYTIYDVAHGFLWALATVVNDVSRRCPIPPVGVLLPDPNALSMIELAEGFERFFLVSGEGSREVLGAALGLDPELVNRLTDLLKTTPKARERMIYGLDTDGSAPSETAFELRGAAPSQVSLAEVREILEKTTKTRP